MISVMIKHHNVINHLRSRLLDYDISVRGGAQRPTGCTLLLEAPFRAGNLLEGLMLCPYESLHTPKVSGSHLSSFFVPGSF